MLQEGDPAPDFRAAATDGEFQLSGLRGRKVVLYFYPRDNTSGCTREACDFRDHIARLRRRRAVVVGVSPDSIASHQKFQAKHELPFPLISDPDHAIARAYGVWVEKTLYGRKSMGIERATFLIDEEGRIERIFRKVKVAGHVEALITGL